MTKAIWGLFTGGLAGDKEGPGLRRWGMSVKYTQGSKRVKSISGVQEGYGVIGGALKIF